MSTPRPRVVKQVCSLCGLDWKDHGKEPTAETCVKLLLDEVLSLTADLARRPAISPLPYVQPSPWWPNPYRPYWPTWYSTISAGTGNTAGGLTWTQTNTSGPQAISVKSQL